MKISYTQFLTLLCVACSRPAAPIPTLIAVAPASGSASHTPASEAPPATAQKKRSPAPWTRHKHLVEEDVRNDLRMYLPIAEAWRLAHPDQCPTLDDLTAAEELSSTWHIEDYWGHRYEIRCADGDTFISSPGADGRSGTADDLVFPAPR